MRSLYRGISGGHSECRFNQSAWRRSAYNSFSLAWITPFLRSAATALAAAFTLASSFVAPTPE